MSLPFGVITISILTPDVEEFAITVKSISFTSSDGPLTILYNHQDYACPVLPGPILLDAQHAYTAGATGFAHVTQNKVVLVLPEVSVVSHSQSNGSACAEGV